MYLLSFEPIFTLVFQCILSYIYFSLFFFSELLILGLLCFFKLRCNSQGSVLCCFGMASLNCGSVFCCSLPRRAILFFWSPVVINFGDCFVWVLIQIETQVDLITCHRGRNALPVVYRHLWTEQLGRNGIFFFCINQKSLVCWASSAASAD